MITALNCEGLGWIAGEPDMVKSFARMVARSFNGTRFLDQTSSKFVCGDFAKFILYTICGGLKHLFISIIKNNIWGTINRTVHTSSCQHKLKTFWQQSPTGPPRVYTMGTYFSFCVLKTTHHFYCLKTSFFPKVQGVFL